MRKYAGYNQAKCRAALRLSDSMSHGLSKKSNDSDEKFVPLKGSAAEKYRYIDQLDLFEAAKTKKPAISRFLCCLKRFS